MSATLTPAGEQRRTSFRETPYRLSFGGVLHSEWIKLTSVRSIGWSIAIAVIVTAAVGILGVWAVLAATAADPTLQDEDATLPLAAASVGIMVSQLVFAVLGVIAMTGEYSSGQIRSSLSAVPTRLPVLGGKALVLGVIAFAASAVAIILSMLGSSLVAGLYDTSLASADFVKDAVFTVLGGSVYLALLTVFGLGIGTIVRSGAGAISIVLGILLVLPAVFGLVQVEWLQEAGQYLISNAGFSVSMPGTEPGEVFWRALLTLIAWATAAIVGAVFTLAMRDA